MECNLFKVNHSLQGKQHADRRNNSHYTSLMKMLQLGSGSWATVLLTPTAALERLLHLCYLLGWQAGGLDSSVGGAEQGHQVGTLCRDLSWVSQGDRNGSKNYSGARTRKTLCIRWKVEEARWLKGGVSKWQFCSQLHPDLHNELMGSSLTILMEGVTSGHPKEQSFP